MCFDFEVEVERLSLASESTDDASGKWEKRVGNSNSGLGGERGANKLTNGRELDRE
jgi:hypothetical protein